MVVWDGYSKTTMHSIKDKLLKKPVRILPTPKVGMFINLKSIYYDSVYISFEKQEREHLEEIYKQNFYIKAITLFDTHLELFII